MVRAFGVRTFGVRTFGVRLKPAGSEIESLPAGLFQ
jgi:hypothetical protein